MVVAEPERTGVLEVLADLGIEIRPELMDRALTHRSYAYEQGGLPTNERMEFLGDAVLQLVVTEHLFTAHPDMSEGQLAKLRAAVVNSRALADVARGLNLGSVIKLGRGEETTGGRDKSSILADTTEAVIGAVFVDHGIEKSRLFVHHLFDPVMDRVVTLGAGLDWKTSLQELCSLNGLDAPQYLVTEAGPDHAKTFTASVLLDGQTYGPGDGHNKKEAEQKAAAIAFDAVRRAAGAETAGGGTVGGGTAGGGTVDGPGSVDGAGSGDGARSVDGPGSVAGARSVDGAGSGDGAGTTRG